MRRRSLGLALTALLAVLPLPSASSVEVPVSVVREQVVSAGTTMHRLPLGTRLVAVTWHRGDAAVRLRWQDSAGWSEWLALDEELPGIADARRGTEPAWLPARAGAVELDVIGAATGVRLVTVAERTERRRSGGATAHAGPTTGRARIGHVISRREWGADERLRSEAPKYSPRVDAVVLHHTVTGDDYSRAEAPAMVRSIYAYHVRSRGYADIAYHFLVDRHGQVFEGRFGGIDRAVRGSHTLGFNTRTSSIAMLGNLEARPPTAALLDGVGRTMAYLAERWGIDPRSSVTLTSEGSTRFPKGRRVTLPRLMGHRDTATTACPGANVYPRLPDLRSLAWRLLAPIIADVAIAGSPIRPPKPATITARLTAPAAWRIELRGPLGVGTLMVSEGRGSTLGLTWDGTLQSGLPAPPGDYTWTATADDGIHGPSTPISGTVTVAVL